MKEDFEFYLPGTSPTQFLLFMGKELGFYKPDRFPQPLKETGVLYRDVAFNNSLTVVSALSYRDDFSPGALRERSEGIRIALFFSVKDRTDEHQTRSVNYGYFLAMNTGAGLNVSGYIDKPKEIFWNEDGSLIPLPEGFPEKDIAGMFDKISTLWPEAIWSMGEPTKPRIQPGPKPRSRAEKIKAFEQGQKRKPGTTIEDFLRERYGEYADGTPKVARSTYYGWGEIKPGQKPGNDSD